MAKNEIQRQIEQLQKELGKNYSKLAKVKEVKNTYKQQVIDFNSTLQALKRGKARTRVYHNGDIVTSRKKADGRIFTKKQNSKGELLMLRIKFPNQTTLQLKRSAAGTFSRILTDANGKVLKQGWIRQNADGTFKAIRPTSNQELHDLQRRLNALKIDDLTARLEALKEEPLEKNMEKLPGEKPKEDKERKIDPYSKESNFVSALEDDNESELDTAFEYFDETDTLEELEQDYRIASEEEEEPAFLEETEGMPLLEPDFTPAMEEAEPLPDKAINNALGATPKNKGMFGRLKAFIGQKFPVLLKRVKAFFKGSFFGKTSPNPTNTATANAKEPWELKADKAPGTRQTTLKAEDMVYGPATPAETTKIPGTQGCFVQLDLQQSFIPEHNKTLDTKTISKQRPPRH